MTRTQAQILESIAALPERDRRELVEHLLQSDLGRRSYLERMTREQRDELLEGIDQAQRGEYSPIEVVIERIVKNRSEAD